MALWGTSTRSFPQSKRLWHPGTTSATVRPGFCSSVRRAHRISDDLGDILDLHLLVSNSLHSIFEHRYAERTGDRERSRPRGDSLFGAYDSDLLPLRDLIPDVGAAPAAAEPVHLRPLHLSKLQPLHGFEDFPGIIEDPVDPSQIAGVMEGNVAVERPG